MAIFGLYGKSKGQKKKEEYLRLFSGRIKRGDKTVPTFSNWLRGKPKTTRRTKTVTRGLKRAGLSEKEIARLRRKR